MGIWSGRNACPWVLQTTGLVTVGEQEGSGRPGTLVLGWCIDGGILTQEVSPGG